ncbi:hypothetical protein K438DRAFT_1755154 [Mycena galopus ATCC 62051]|nr:hypothetical protein K438DRAFT_1755154 [Mycena galopus ATCC 62051]
MSVAKENQESKAKTSEKARWMEMYAPHPSQAGYLSKRDICMRANASNVALQRAPISRRADHRGRSVPHMTGPEKKRKCKKCVPDRGEREPESRQPIYMRAENARKAGQDRRPASAAHCVNEDPTRSLPTKPGGKEKKRNRYLPAPMRDSPAAVANVHRAARVVRSSPVSRGAVERVGIGIGWRGDDDGRLPPHEGTHLPCVLCVHPRLEVGPEEGGGGAIAVGVGVLLVAIAILELGLVVVVAEEVVDVEVLASGTRLLRRVECASEDAGYCCDPVVGGYSLVSAPVLRLRLLLLRGVCVGALVLLLLGEVRLGLERRVLGIVRHRALLVRVEA